MISVETLSVKYTIFSQVLRNHLLFEDLVQTTMVLSSDMDWHGSQWIGANGRQFPAPLMTSC